MKSKILLIKPPSKLGATNPSLGLGYLAAALEKAEFVVKIIDAPAERFDVLAIYREAKVYKPAICGLTATTPEFSQAARLAKMFKTRSRYISLVLGGPHVTAQPVEAMYESAFDFAVIGEGERTFLELVTALDQGRKNFSDIRGIAYRDNKKIMLSLPRERITNLDRIPYPAYHLMPSLTKYLPSVGSYKNLPFGAIITSRGCPFRCSFCDRSIFGNQVRLRSPENVLGELKILVRQYGAREIRFWDDTINLDTKRVIKICQQIIKEKLNISWTALGRVNFAGLEMLRWMKKAGCWQISYGVESGNQNILNRIHKGITLEMVRQAVEKTKRAGIEVKCFFMIGLPGDTIKSIQETIDFAKNLDPDIATFSITTPFPGTEIYHEALKSGEFRKIDFTNYYPAELNDKVGYIPRGLTAKKILDFQKKALREFYFRPKIIFREIRKIRNFTMLLNKFRGVFDLISAVSNKKSPTVH